MQNLELVKERGIRFIKKTFRLPAIGWSAKDGVRTGTVCAILRGIDASKAGRLRQGAPGSSTKAR